MGIIEIFIIGYFIFLVIFLGYKSIKIFYIDEKCPKGWVHNWTLIDYKTSSYKDSGFTIYYKYCKTYQCTKCKELDEYQNRYYD